MLCLPQYQKYNSVRKTHCEGLKIIPSTRKIIHSNDKHYMRNQDKTINIYLTLERQAGINSSPTNGLVKKKNN